MDYVNLVCMIVTSVINVSTSLERRLERILNVLDNVASEASEGIPIVVEGEKDINALKRLSVAGNFISAKTSGKSLLDVLSEVEAQEKPEVIMLMDFDKRGREMTVRLARGLERMGIKPNLVFWKTLFSLVGRDVKDVEGLVTYVKNLQEKMGKNILNV